MMKYKQKQEKAKILYLNSVLSQKQIAENVGITENTISSWIQKFGWKDLKAAMSITRDKVVSTTYRQIYEIQQKAIDEARTLTPSESDQMVKLGKMIKEMGGSIDAPVVIQVLISCEKFLQGRMSEDRKYISLDQMKMINSYHDAFVSFMMNQGES